MLNAEKLKASASKGAGSLVKNQYSGNNTFPWTNPSDFKPGSFKLRWCPRDPVKCPESYHIYTTYSVEKEIEGDLIKVLAMESWAPDQDDYIMEILQVYSQVKEHLTLSVRSAIEEMFPTRYYLFPMTVFARPVMETNRKSGKEYQKLIADSDAEEMGIILAIKQTKDETLPPLAARLASLAETYRGLNMEDEQGRYMKFTRTGEGKQTRYTLDALPDTEPMGNKNVLADYPDFNKFGEKKRKDYYAMKSLLQSCWWWEPFTNHVDV